MQANIELASGCTLSLLSHMICYLFIFLVKVLYDAYVSLDGKCRFATPSLHIHVLLLLLWLAFLQLRWNSLDCTLYSSWRSVFIPWAPHTWQILSLLRLKCLRKWIDCFWSYRELLLLCLIDDISLISDCLHIGYRLQKSTLHNVVEAVRSFEQMQCSLSPGVVCARRLIERFNQLVVILDSNGNIQNLLIINLLLCVYWSPLLPAPLCRTVRAPLGLFLVIWRGIWWISLLLDRWMHFQ